MRNDIKDNTWLTAAQCARRIGLTVRALRLYEQTGLIQPRRTGKNWRLYGANEIARLNEILALKRLGLSLQHIARLLSGTTTDLDRILAMQTMTLKEQLERSQRSLAIMEALRTKIAAGDLPSIEELLKLAKDTNMSDTASDTIAWRRYEQTRPRTEHKIDPALYADYAGHYRLEMHAFEISQREGKLFARLTGQVELEIFPEGIDRFFYKAVPAQLTFTRNENGEVSGLVLHQDGYEQGASRVEESIVTEMEEALAKRIREKRPVDNSKALLEDLIRQHQRGEPDYTRMRPPLEVVARDQYTMIKADLDRLGQLNDLSFKGVTSEGWDVYDASFDNGHLECSFILADDGKFSGILFRPSV